MPNPNGSVYDPFGFSAISNYQSVTEMNRNLTTGSITKALLCFSLPYLLSYFLQTLYGMADLYIIGQFESVGATTAVSIGSQVMHMLTVLIVGLSMGTTVAVASAVGAGDSRKAARAIGNTITLNILISVLLTATLLLLTRPITHLMSTPAEAADGCAAYLFVCFMGIPFITAYNVICAIFRALGDSKKPMYFVAIACFANILLDYFFIGSMKLGPIGAALGTVCAQTISVLAALVTILRRKNTVSISKKDFRLERKSVYSVLRVGIPIAIQDGLIQVSFLIITLIANGRGLTDAAAVGIVEKIIGFIFLVPSSMMSALSAVGAQNIGASRRERAVEALRCALMITVGFGAIVAIVFQFISTPAVALFTNDHDVAVAGGEYLRGYIFDALFAGIHFCFSGYFCALGRSELSFIHNITAIVAVRVPGAYLTSRLFPDTLFPMGIATAAGSLLSSIICTLFFVHTQKQYKTNTVR